MDFNSNFMDLRIWQQSMEICEKIYDLLKKFPKEEVFGLTLQLRRAVTSIPFNIAEGHGKGTSKEFKQGLIHARGSNCEVQTQLLLSERFGYISEEECSSCMNDLINNVKGINNMIKYLDSIPNRK